VPGLLTLKCYSASRIALWGLVVGAGFLLLQGYAARPGDAGKPPVSWPAGSLIPRDGRRPTLLIFLHPCCPCSAASLAELAAILDRHGDRVSAHALLLQPSRPPRQWRRSAIEQELANLPDLHIWQDRNGAEALRFGVVTSGHVLLYEVQGRLTFSGGITPARGHRGENCGRAAVLARIFGEEGEVAENPVFGCSLATPGAPTSQEPQR
jgi:hypothetical protein